MFYTMMVYYWSAVGVLFIIGAFSIVSLSIIIERIGFMWQFRGIFQNIEDYILFKNDQIENIPQDMQEVSRKLKESIDYGGNKDKLNMELDYLSEKLTSMMGRRRDFIRMIATISPILGILGTVLGMITSFSSITQDQQYQEIFIGGIAQAMYTTVFGLILAIVCYIFNSYLSYKIDNYIERLYFSVQWKYFESKGEKN